MSLVVAFSIPGATTFGGGEVERPEGTDQPQCLEPYAMGDSQIAAAADRDAVYDHAEARAISSRN